MEWVFASLIVQADSAPLTGCPQRTQEITLYNNIKRIDFANRILKDATPGLELYFAFPFAADQPQFRYEASNAVIEPIRDAKQIQQPVCGLQRQVCARWKSHDF